MNVALYRSNWHRAIPYLQLMRLHRPIGTFLLLWPALIALWLASFAKPKLFTVFIFVAGVVVMRAAGCVINDYADRNIDPHVARTKNRPIAAGHVCPKHALILFGLLLSIAAILALQLNSYAFKLSFIAAALAIIYPFAKRFTYYPQFILGLAFSWSIPMIYAEVRGYLSLETWLLYASTMLWVIAYDTQYALADKIDDLRIGVKSTAIAFGNYDKLIIFCLQLLALGGFALIAWQRNLGVSFYLSLIIAFLLMIYQQYLLRDRVPALCFLAFLNNNYFGAVIFAGLLFDEVHISFIQ